MCVNEKIVNFFGKNFGSLPEYTEKFKENFVLGGFTLFFHFHKYLIDHHQMFNGNKPSKLMVVQLSLLGTNKEQSYIR